MATQTAPHLPQIAKLAADGRAQLLEHVDVEIKGLKAELDTLQQTRQALTGKHTLAAPAAKAANGQRTATRRPARTTEKPVSEEAVLEAIRAGMGDQSPTLAKALKATPDLILRRLRALEAKGMLVREGERANTRWVIPVAVP